MKSCSLASAVLLCLSVLVSSNSHQNHTLYTDDYARKSTETRYYKYFTMDYKDQGYVNGGSLLSFDNSLTAQEKSDILESILYAQQIANERYDRTKDFEQWYTTFSNMLRKTTWTFDYTKFTKYTSTSSFFQLTQTTYTMLQHTCAPTQSEVLKRLLTAWESLHDYDQRVTTFLKRSGRGTTQTNAANFQIMPVARGKPGEVLIVYGAFYYEAQTTVGRYLTYFWPSQSISLKYSVVIASFRSSNYKTIRKQISSTLGDRATSLVQEIDI